MKTNTHWSSSVRQLCGGAFPPIGRWGPRLARTLLPKNLRAYLFPGVALNLDLEDLTMMATYWRGTRFEGPTGAVLEHWASDAEAFFDMGSNYGFFSWWLASKYPDLGIYPFEPNPKTFAKVITIASENGLRHVHPQNLGLSDQAGELTLHSGLEDSGHSTFGDHPGLQDAPIARVGVLPFDCWLKSVSIPLPQGPRWVGKIDVEGFELKVLSGMKESLAAKRFKGIAVEINSFTLEMCGATAGTIRELLNFHGYQEVSAGEILGKSRLPGTANSFFVPRGKATGM